MFESERRPFPTSILTCCNFYMCVCVHIHIILGLVVVELAVCVGSVINWLSCTIMSFTSRNL